MQDLFVEIVPGAKGQAHTSLEVGHFIQDNAGEALAEVLNRFIADNPDRMTRAVHLGSQGAVSTISSAA